MTENFPQSDADWRAALTQEQYAVLRGRGTEAPFSGEYVYTTDAGVYTCAARGAELFKSATKFDARCGWPSFFDAIKNAAPDKNSGEKNVAGAAVKLAPDTSHGMTRTEVTCARCGSHLGHLFADGPAPTGARYCINSIALKLKK